MSIALFILFLDIATVTFVVHANDHLPKVRDQLSRRLLSVYCGKTRHTGSTVQESIKSAMNNPNKEIKNRVNGKANDASHGTYEVLLPSPSRSSVSDHAIVDEQGKFVKAFRKKILPNGNFVTTECKSKIYDEKKIQQEKEETYHILTQLWNH